jgi:glutaminyl-peptide cyclotransferase
MSTTMLRNRSGRVVGIAAAAAAVLILTNPACGQTGSAPATKAAAKAPATTAAQAPAKPAPIITATPQGFDGAKAYDHVREVVAIGPRPPGSAAIEATRTYIKKQLAAIGVTATEQVFDADTPLGRFRMVNVIARIPGTSSERIVFAGHYDTKIFREFRFVGANDAGSSTAFLIEWARVLKGRKNPYTVELLFLDGEEATRPDWLDPDNRYGSRHYVDATRKDGSLASLRALVLVDMIGDRDLRIKRESMSTSWLTDAIWASAKKLDHGDVFVNELTPIEDDHVPFLNAGVAAVDIIDLDYAPWHTAGDTLDKVGARSLQIVGDVLLDAMPAIEKRLAVKK